MHFVVHHVPCDESGEERSRPHLAEDGKKKKVKQRGKWNAHNRRHHQAERVVRICMMDAVKEKDQTLSPCGRRLIVKPETVKQIFRQCPEEQTEDKPAGDFSRVEQGIRDRSARLQGR